MNVLRNRFVRTNGSEQAFFEEPLSGPQPSEHRADAWAGTVTSLGISLRAMVLHAEKPRVHARGGGQREGQAKVSSGEWRLDPKFGLKAVEHQHKFK